MRTTLTLDPDLARLIDEEVHRQRKTFKQVVNDALRRGLAQQVAAPVKPYRVRPHDAKLRAGIDRMALNRLSEELDDEAALTRTVRDRG